MCCIIHVQFKKGQHMRFWYLSHMRNCLLTHPAWLEVSHWVSESLSTLCMRATKAQANLHIFAASPEPLLLDSTISTCAKISHMYVGSFCALTHIGSLSLYLLCVCEQRSLWRVCAFAQARLSLCYSTV